VFVIVVFVVVVIVIVVIVLGEEAYVAMLSSTHRPVSDDLRKFVS